MARTADLKVTTRIDLATLRASFKEAAKIAREELSEITGLMENVVRPNPTKLRAQYKDLFKSLADEARKAVETDSTTAATPKAPKQPKAPKAEPPTPDSTISAEEANQRRLDEIEARHAAIREAMSQKTTSQLVEHVIALREERQKASLAAAEAVTKEEKSIAQARLRGIKEELEIASRAMKQRPEVINEGAGASAGFLGLFRKIAGAGSIAFNAFNQQVSAAAGALSDLSQPTVALDKVTAQLRTLGKEAADMAPNLREAALEMSEDLPFGAADIQQAMFDALASGVKGGEEGLKGFADTAAKLATGGGAELGSAVGLLAGQLNAYGKSSEEAGKFADIFFNTVNYGVTSIPELSSTLANVVPTAAGLGIELESVGGALAQMTQKGIPTAQATTKLNQLFIELAKPAASLAPILKAAGVSLESLKQDDLPTTLAKVQAALDKTGKSAVQVFGSSEAAAAFQSLSGDLNGFRKTFEDVRDTTGSAQNAYTEMADSIDVRTKGMIASVQSFITEGLSKLGNGVLSTVQSASQLAPMFTSLSGIKGLLPTGMFSGVLKEVADLKAAGQGPGGLIGMFQLLGGKASEAGSGIGRAFSSLGSVMMGPVGIILGVVTAVVLLYNNVKEVRAAVAGMFEWVSTFFGGLGEAISDIFSGAGIVETMGRLFNDAGIAANAAFLAKLNEEQIKEAIERLGTALDDAMQRKEKNEGVTAVDALLKKYNEATDEVQKQELAKAIAEQMPSAVNKVQEFDEATGQLKTTYEVNTEALQRYIDKTKEETGKPDAENALDVLNGLKAAAQQLDENKEKVKALQEQMAARKASGLDTKSLEVDIEAAKKAAEDSQKAFRESWDKTQKSGALVGIDKIAVNTGEVDIGQSILKGGMQFKMDEVSVQAEMDKLRSDNKEVFDGIEADAKAVQIGKALSEGASIQGKIQGAEAIDDLISKYNSASTDAERDGLGAAIARQVPGAVQGMKQIVDEQGNIKTVYDINVGKAKEFADAQKASASNDLIGRQKTFRDGIESQAESLATARDNARDLSQKIVEGARKGKDVSGLQQEYDKLTEKINAGTKELGTHITEGKKVGLIKGDVAGVGKEFKLSGRAAVEAANAVKTIGEQTAEATAEVADMAAAFAEMRQQADKNVSENLAKIALVAAKTKLGEQVSEQEKADAEAAKIAIGNAVARQKTIGKIVEDLEIRYGIRRRERQKTLGRDLSGLDRELAAERTRMQTRLAAIDNDYLRSIAAAQNEIILKKREFNIQLRKLDEEIRLANDISDVRERNARIKSLRDQKADIQIGGRTYAAEMELLNTRLDEVIRSGRDKLATDILGVADTAEKGTLELRRILNDALTPIEGDASSDVLRKQGKERLAIIRESGRAQMLERIAQDAAFATRAKEGTEREVADLADAQRRMLEIQEQYRDQRSQLLATGISEADADTALTTLRASLEDAESDVTALGEVLANRLREIRASMLDEISGMTQEQIAALPPAMRALAMQLKAIAVTTTRDEATERFKAEKAIREREHKERLASVEDIAEQERLTELFQLEEWKREQLFIHQGNAAKIAEIEREAAEKRAKIEEDHQRKVNAIVAAALDFRDALFDAFFGKLDDKQREQLQRTIDDLGKEEQALKDSFDKRLIDYNEYRTRQAEIAKRKSEAERQIAGSTGNFLQDLQNRSATALEKSREAVEKRYDEGLDARRKKATEGEKLTWKQVGKFATEGAAIISLKLGEVAAQGKLFTTEGANAVLATAWDTLQKLATTWFAGILGSSLTFLGPIAGPIAAATFTGLLQAALSAARGAVLGAKDGIVRLRGPGSRTSDSIPARLSDEESVINAAATLAGGPRGFTNIDALTWANKRKRPLAEFFAPMFRSMLPKIDPAVARRAMEMPQMSLSALEVTAEGLPAAAIAELIRAQEATASEVAALRQQNTVLIRETRGTRKSNEEMARLGRRPQSRSPRWRPTSGSY